MLDVVMGYGLVGVVVTLVTAVHVAFGRRVSPPSPVVFMFAVAVSVAMWPLSLLYLIYELFQPRNWRGHD